MNFSLKLILTFFICLLSLHHGFAQEKHLAGTWEIVEITAEEPIKLHKDAESSSLLSTQMNCFGGTIIFSKDGRSLRRAKKNDCSVSTCEMTYTVSENKITIVGPQTKTGSYKYSKGELILFGLEEVYNANSKRWVPVAIHLKKKSKKSFIPKRAFPDGLTVKETRKNRFELFNNQGLLVQILALDNCNRQFEKISYSYDNQQRIVEERTSYKKDEIYKSETFRYVNEDALPDTIIYFNNGFNKTDRVVSLEYDKQGRITKRSSLDRLFPSTFIEKTKFSGDYKSEEVKEWINADGELTATEVDVFDKYGQLLTKNFKDFVRPKRNSHFEKEYNDQNLLVRTLKKMQYSTEEEVYVYDLDARTVVITETITYNHNHEPTTSSKTFYLTEGNKPDYKRPYSDSEVIPSIVIESQEQ